MFDEIIEEIETRCSNKLETQHTIAHSYANMLNYLDFISDDKIKIANAAVKARYPSNSGFDRVKRLAWEIAEKRQRRPTKHAADVASTTSAEPDSDFESVSAVESDTQPRG
jgi:hypothetical protein